MKVVVVITSVLFWGLVIGTIFWLYRCGRNRRSGGDQVEEPDDHYGEGNGGENSSSHQSPPITITINVDYEGSSTGDDGDGFAPSPPPMELVYDNICPNCKEELMVTPWNLFLPCYKCIEGMLRVKDAYTSRIWTAQN